MSLELKIPPALIALLIAGIMWLGSLVASDLDALSPNRYWIALASALAGTSLIVAAGIQSRKHQTTVNPMRPRKTSRIVTSGVYRFTRNPMYLGGLLILVGWAAVLGSPIALVLSGAFVWYMKRFQIGPEEQTLLSLPGPEYSEYMRQVRRWI